MTVKAKIILQLTLTNCGVFEICFVRSESTVQMIGESHVKFSVLLQMAKHRPNSFAS